ncbi:MAG: hypothetical protein ACI865_001688 [Flavobacteriaceae bacterium]|jgi:hypothetical protein
MKKINLLFVAFLCPFIMWSQDGINYQAAVRDGAGALLINQAVSAGFEIRETSAVGTVVYSETHAVNTNDYGLINVVIGAGTVVTGVYDDIDWGSDAHFLDITIDGNNLGALQFNAVPYAHHAESLRNVDTDTPLAEVEISAAVENTRLLISPDAGAINDTSTIFLGEGLNNPDYGMTIMYDGANNVLQVGGANLTGTTGPHLSITRDAGVATFTQGVVVEETTDAPAANTVYGNTGPLAYGLYAAGGLSTDYGVTSITETSPGVFDIILDNDWAGSPVVIATSFNNSSDTESVTYSTTGTNTITVRIVDENNTATTSNFSFVVHGLRL